MFSRSRRNLARWFALSMGSVLVVFAGVVYYLEVREQIRAFDYALYQKSKAITADSIYRYRLRQGQLELETRPQMGSNSLPLGSDLAYVRWYDPRGNPVQFAGTPPQASLSVPPGFQTIRPVGHLAKSEVWLRQLTLPILQKNFLIGYLQVATPLSPVQGRLEKLRLLLTVSVPVSLGVIGLTGWFLGGLAMRPIHQAYEGLQRFTADASHELRAPLAAVLSNAQVGLLTPAGDGSQQRQRLENIVETVKSMSILVNNLLLLARHEGVLAPAALKDVDLVQLLRELADNQAEQFTAQNLEFSSHLPQQPVGLRADPDLLRQAVLNLLSNACKYTPVGGTVQLRLFTQSRCAVIQVEDSGIGIPATDLPHVFERFYRVDVARSRATGGFGLGLAIAQQIVQSHGGQIVAKSVVGQGSTFQIELPL
jgi:signal transduction histidine kinase